MLKWIAVLCLLNPVTAWAEAHPVSVGFGLERGALNFGGQYDWKGAGYDHGVYLHLQTDREKNGAKIVYQVLSLGAQLKAHLVQNGFMNVYAAPGFGVHMFKDLPDGAGSKSDITAWGPTLRLGVLSPLPNGLKIGVERFEIWNWFDDKPPASVPFYQATLVLEF